MMFRRLEIAVQDAALVRRGHTGANLPRHFNRLLLREAADASQQRRQILAVHVFHRQERAAVGIADVVGAADVAMRDRPGDADFVVKLREARGIVREGVGQELEGDGLSELEVVGAVTLTHTAAAERCDDPEAAGEDGSRGEASPAGAARGERAGAGRLAREARQVVHPRGVIACATARSRSRIA
jgi:hypothetical protein